MQPLGMSIKDTAHTLGIGKSFVYELLRAGHLEAYKIGRRTLVTTSSITRLASAARPKQEA